MSGEFIDSGDDMPLVTFFDTESTGLLPKTFEIDKIDKLPHIVQVAAILVDIADYKEYGSFDLLVKPNGYEIPESSTKIHGITKDMAEKDGVGLSHAMNLFDSFVQKSAGIVAHNVEFDSRMMVISYIRVGMNPDVIWKKAKKCTMRASKDICRLPGKFKDYKWPKLMEAHEILLGETFEGAHNALHDIRACIRIYKHLKGINAI